MTSSAQAPANGVFVTSPGYALGEIKAHVTKSAAAGRLRTAPDDLASAGFAWHYVSAPGSLASRLYRSDLGRLVVKAFWDVYSPGWDERGLADIRAYIGQFLTTTWREYYNPDVYGDCGFRQPYQVADDAWAAPAQREHRTGGDGYLGRRIAAELPVSGRDHVPVRDHAHPGVAGPGARRYGPPAIPGPAALAGARRAHTAAPATMARVRPLSASNPG